MNAPLPSGCEPHCPGCAHRSLTAAASAAQKAAWLRRALAPWSERLAPLVSPPQHDRLRYRDRVALWAGWDGGWRLGLLADEEIVDIPRCPVHSARVEAVLDLLRQALPPASVFPLAFYVQAGPQVTLILKTATPPPMDWLKPALRQDLAEGGLEGLWIHLHPSAGRRLFAKNGWLLAWGRPRSRDGDGLIHGPTAFQQLTPALYRASLDAAFAFLAPTAASAVVDLYCGIGASLRRWRAAGAAAVGVELGAEAVECARLNAPGAEVLRGCCAQRLPQLRSWLNGRVPLVYVNPPRTGLEPEVLEWLAAEARPPRLAYLSCSAGTLGRDLERLCAAGYRVEALRPYDFFPRTHHVETLALLVNGAGR